MATFKQIAIGMARGAAIGFTVGAVIDHVRREKNISKLVSKYSDAVGELTTLRFELSDATSRNWAAEETIEDLKKQIARLESTLKQRGEQ